MPRAKISTVDKERQVGGQLWLKRTRGRARRGHRAVQVVGGQRGPNITSVFAVSNIRSLILHEIFPRAMTGDRFVQFLSRVSTSSGHRRITFVFANAPVHRRAGESVIAETHAPLAITLLTISQHCGASFQLLESWIEEAACGGSASTVGTAKRGETGNFVPTG